MRVSFGLTLLAAGALASGCQGGEERLNNELRAQMMTRCIGDIAPKAAGVPGFDANLFCNCVTDRAIGNRNVAEVKAMFEDKAGTAEAGRRAARECVAKQMPGGAGGVPPPPPAEPAAAGAEANGKAGSQADKP